MMESGSLCNSYQTCDTSAITFAVFTSSVGGESAGAVALLAFWPAIIEATKIREDNKPTDFFPWVRVGLLLSVASVYVVRWRSDLICCCSPVVSRSPGQSRSRIRS